MYRGRHLGNAMNNQEVIRSYEAALALLERKALSGDESTMALLAPAAVLLRDAINKAKEEGQ